MADMKTITILKVVTGLAVTLTVLAGCASSSSGTSDTPTTAAAPKLLPGAGHAGVKVPAGTYAVVVHGSQSQGQPMPVNSRVGRLNGAGFAVNTGVGSGGHAFAPDARGLAFWEVGECEVSPSNAGKQSSTRGRPLPTSPRRWPTSLCGPEPIRCRSRSPDTTVCSSDLGAE